MSSTHSVRACVGAIVASVALSATVPTAEAQYFGRNKVQYENFDFEVIKTDHFDIYYYPEEQVAVEYAALMAERWYARLSRLLNHELSGRQPLILYASGPHFRQTNTLQGDLGEATGGVTEILKRRIVLPFAGPLPETDHVLGHELVHAFQFDMTGEGGGIAMAGVPSVMRFPLWFVEGMAEYLSVGARDPNTAMWMRDAVREELPSVEKLSDPRFFPYRWGQSLWAYVAGRWGDDAVGRILKASRSARNPALAFGRILRVSADSVVQQWHRQLRATYLPLMDETSPPDDYGRALITPITSGGRLNIAPSLSPDGDRIVFLSERDLFSVDMFLADTKTGEILKKITRTAVDPHFESLQFIYSAGAWDHSGERFVFGAITKGRPVLTIMNIERGNVEREVQLPELGEVYNPSWSRDGRYVAFSGLVGGLSDLYVYDLQESVLRRLTNDAYADLQPAWSPDGSTLAFVTDRFSTGLSSLLYGNYRIGLIDASSGAVRPLQAFDEGKHINPQWSPDGQSLYFVSDQNGISNLYRAEVASGELHQVTNLYTGISGITALSPALTVAARSGEVAFSVYEEDVNAVYLAEEPEVLAGGPVLPPFVGIDPALLPPTQRLTDDVASLLANAFFGLPDTVGYTRDTYRPKFALDYIAQPSLAVGADRFGTYIAGGAALFWSDMLGGHNLATALQVQGSLKDIAALVGYSNLTKRLNWTVSAQQIPYLSGFVNLFIDQSGHLVEDVLLLRQTNRSISSTFAYPLSRVQRIEGSAGFLNITFDAERRIRGVFIDTTINLDARDALNLGQASAALVYDNSFFGIASPLLGQRYRLEAGTTFGSLDFFTGIADFRKYVMPVRPFTLAARVLHYGRYGPDADTLALPPLFLGYDGLVRGYGFGSFDFFEECEIDGSCPNYSQLWGSKMIVANLEIRFPPLGVLGLGSGLFGFLPIEMVIFGDAGLAWYGADRIDFVGDEFDDRPFFSGGDRRPIYSAGTGLRMNLFGIAIIELDWVYPFNRARGGHFQFSFAPGF